MKRKGPSFRGWFRNLTIVGGASCLAIAIVSGACLPDLAPLTQPARNDLTEGSTPPGPFCGDGVIETLDNGASTGESCDPGEGGTAGCEGCVFRCEGATDPVGGHCYFVVGSHARYDDAKIACSARGAHLVTFASASEVMIADRITDGGGYWLGLQQRGAIDYRFDDFPNNRDEPGFAAGCSGCFGLGADGGDFPGDDAGTGCLVGGGSAWKQIPCTLDGELELQTVCEREPVGRRAFACGGPFCTTLEVTAGKKRYVIVLAPTSAATVARVCQDLYGGDLVMFASGEEREALANEIRALVGTEDYWTFWIGARSTGGSWGWEDASIDAAIPWGAGAPSDAGAAETRAFLRLSPSGIRTDTDLARNLDDEPGFDPDAGRGFICERPPPKGP